MKQNHVFGYTLPHLRVLLAVLSLAVTLTATRPTRAAPPTEPRSGPAPGEPEPVEPIPASPRPLPYPPPGYARWYLPPPARPISYLDDLPAETEGRHLGFFMRLAFGPGYYVMQARSAAGPLRLAAAGAGLELVLGGALSENLVAYGEISLHSTLDPIVDSYQGPDSAGGTSVTTTGIGGGLAYWFMPTNLYLAVSVLVAETRAVDRPTERLIGRTDLGPGLAVAFGKEWWMSPRWALGLRLRALLARFRDPSHGRGGAMWDARGLSLAFSVTFE